MKCGRLAVLVLLLLTFSNMAQAHHSYAMFDGSRRSTVIGSVAKLEWLNPHAFLWVYVPTI